MSSFTKGDYLRIYALACDLHNATTNTRVREAAAELMDLVERVTGQVHRPRGMRGPLATAATAIMTEENKPKGPF